MEIRYFPISGSGANCYLIKTENAAVVIDPFEADPRIIAFFEENKENDKYILLTHCHFDHILGAERLREMFGATIVIGEKDEVGLRDATLSLSAWVGLEQKPFSADVLVKDGEVLNLGGTDFTVLHTAGHTAGSVCYIVEDMLFSGDTLFKDSIGRTDFPTGDMSTLRASLIKLKNLGRDYTVYSGHGDPTTLYREIKNNPYMI